MVKPTTADDIVVKSPTKNIPPITGEPNYDSISQLDQLIYCNTATLPTPLGGGAHGRVDLIMKATIYTTLSATTYVTPTVLAIIPEIQSTANIAA